jgi:hypothetical protein
MKMLMMLFGGGGGGCRESTSLVLATAIITNCTFSTNLVYRKAKDLAITIIYIQDAVRLVSRSRNFQSR